LIYSFFFDSHTYNTSRFNLSIMKLIYMKLYKKLTLINTILGITVCIIILLIYFFINSLIGIPLLGLFLGGTILHVLILLFINLAGIVSIFYIKNIRIMGIALIIYGTLVLATATFFGIPGFVLFVIAGILALKEKQVVKESK
jgi:hypothetical protein